MVNAPFIVELKMFAKAVPLSMLIMLTTMMLILGSSFVYGVEVGPQMQIVLVVYSILLLLTRTEIPKKEHVQLAIIPMIISFGLTFMATLIFMQVLIGVPGVSGTLASVTPEASIAFAVQFGVLHALVKAYIEEEVFRARLSTVFGEVGQAIIFGIFHFFVLISAFGASPTTIIAGAIWLTFLGLVWGIMENRFGVSGATASHFAYNLVVFGMLPIITTAAVV